MPGKACYQVWRTNFEIDTKYQPIKAIGKGAYGVVCSAKNAETGEKVRAGGRGSALDAAAGGGAALARTRGASLSRMRRHFVERLLASLARGVRVERRVAERGVYGAELVLDRRSGGVQRRRRLAARRVRLGAHAHDRVQRVLRSGANSASGTKAGQQPRIHSPGMQSRGSEARAAQSARRRRCLHPLAAPARVGARAAAALPGPVRSSDMSERKMTAAQAPHAPAAALRRRARLARAAPRGRGRRRRRERRWRAA